MLLKMLKGLGRQLDPELGYYYNILLLLLLLLLLLDVLKVATPYVLRAAALNISEIAK
jgi:hypothetical protein